MPEMATIDPRGLSALVAVVRAGSFTAAARRLGTQKAHLSRVVARLEAQLGAQLMVRSTRSVSLTEVGREVFERALAVLAALDETEQVAQQSQVRPRGVLRVTCGLEFGLLAVNAWIAALLRAHPEVRVEADYTNRVVDLIHEGFDVAVRVGQLDDSGLAARRLGEVGYALYAAPRYLRRRRAPRTIDELAAHDLVLSTQTALPGAGGGRRWRLSRQERERTLALLPRLLVNTHIAARDAAAAGLGIALLPRFQAQPLVEAGALRLVLAGWACDPVPVHAVFAGSRFLSPKVRAFVDAARAGFDAVVNGPPSVGPGPGTAARPSRS